MSTTEIASGPTWRTVTHFRRWHRVSREPELAQFPNCNQGFDRTQNRRPQVLSPLRHSSAFCVAAQRSRAWGLAKVPTPLRRSRVKAHLSDSSKQPQPDCLEEDVLPEISSEHRMGLVIRCRSPTGGT